MERTLALIEQAHQGDKAARERLVEENLGLVLQWQEGSGDGDARRRT